MTLKKRLAAEIITQLYSKEETRLAEAHFVRVFQKRELPDNIREYRTALTGGTDLRDILVGAKIARSRSEASRLIEQGAVEIDGQKVVSFNSQIKDGSIIKVGARRFIRIVNTD